MPEDRTGRALRAVAELEALDAGGADVTRLLARCEEVRELARGTAYESRLRDLEARLLEQKRAKEREERVVRALEDARKILAHPRAVDRKADVLSLLRAVRPVAAGRLAEVDRLIDEAERLREETPLPAPPPRGVERRVIFREDFDQGPGRFVRGRPVEGGRNGTKALEVPREGVRLERPFSGPVTERQRVRFWLKPFFKAEGVEMVFWSARRNLNHWYHIRGLREGEWNLVEIPVAEARGHYMRTGPSLEGEIPDNLVLYFDDTVTGARLLLDDFEILE